LAAEQIFDLQASVAELVEPVEGNRKGVSGALEITGWDQLHARAEMQLSNQILETRRRGTHHRIAASPQQGSQLPCLL